MVASLRAGGVVQAFGSGHSEALAMEFAGRAGGLVPTNRIALRDLVIFGGEPPEVLGDPHRSATRRSPAGCTTWPRCRRPTSSWSARTPASTAPSSSSPSWSSSAGTGWSRSPRSRRRRRWTRGTRPATKLIDHADVALDNGAPYGDALLPLPGGGTVCAVSSITGALLAQLVVAEVVRRLARGRRGTPVYLSANVPGGDEHNRILEARYAGRIRRTA